MEADGDAIPAAPEDLMQMNEAQASGRRRDAHTPGDLVLISLSDTNTISIYYHKSS